MFVPWDQVECWNLNWRTMINLSSEIYESVQGVDQLIQVRIPTDSLAGFFFLETRWWSNTLIPYRISTPCFVEEWRWLVFLNCITLFPKVSLISCSSTPWLTTWLQLWLSVHGVRSGIPASRHSLAGLVEYIQVQEGCSDTSGCWISLGNTINGLRYRESGHLGLIRPFETYLTKILYHSTRISWFA